jgi:hypothetical protein
LRHDRRIAGGLREHAMDYEQIRFERRGRVGLITLNLKS